MQRLYPCRVGSTSDVENLCVAVFRARYRAGEETMSITLLCPRLRCRAILQVPDDVRGKRVRCGECGASFFVPEIPKSKPPPNDPAEVKSPE